MTDTRTRFGDLLAAAHRHLAAAARQQVSATPGRDTEEIATAMLRVVTSLRRYAADMTRVIDELPSQQLTRLTSWDRAALQTRDALASAVEALEHGGPGTDAPLSTASSPTARHLQTAAASLAAGRDLLQGHFVTGPGGARLHHSGWAVVISSTAVNRALLSETASLAQRTAIAAESSLQLDRAKAKLGADHGRRISMASQWLRQLDEHVSVAARREPPSRPGNELLIAIPANVMPELKPPDVADSVPELCRAVIITAERARQAAWKAATLDARSTAISVTSWQRIAAASTVTSHNCHLLWSTLADRVAQEHRGKLGDELRRAAAYAERARDSWLHAAWGYREVTTDIRSHVSPAAAEASELALWTGRLAYADPDWTLASSPSQPVRAPASLAPQLADLPGVIAAVHHASDSLASLATANLEQARAAVGVERLLVPTRSLPDNYDIPQPFALAPPSYAASLLTRCQDTRRSVIEAAAAAGALAERTRASSRTLSVARAAVRDEHHSGGVERDTTAGREPSPRSEPRTTEPAPGPVATRLVELGLANPRLLWRAGAIDRAGQQLVNEAFASPARELHGRSDPVSPVAAKSHPAAASASRRGQSARNPMPHADLEAEP